MSEWIKTSERLPELNDAYLVYGGKAYDIHIRYFNPDYNCWDTDDGADYYCDALDIAYWMKLPSIPCK